MFHLNLKIWFPRNSKQGVFQELTSYDQYKNSCLFSGVNESTTGDCLNRQLLHQITVFSNHVEVIVLSVVVVQGILSVGLDAENFFSLNLY